jgi:predicted NACHT family NTPase
LEKPKRRIDYSLNHVLSLNVCEKFQFAIAELKTQLPDVPKFSTIINDFWIRKEFIDWWTINSSAWIAKLRSVMIEYRNIGHDWQFSDTQKKQLQQYYDANKLLVDCLNTDCYVSREVRQEIEETLLLPIAEIQKRQQRG